MIAISIDNEVYCQSQNYVLVDSYTADSILMHDSTIIIFDVRTKPEYKAGHIKNALHSNFLGFKFLQPFKEMKKAQSVMLYCETGHRSKFAARKIEKLGLKVFDLEGGFSSWRKRGYPVYITEKKRGDRK